VQYEHYDVTSDLVMITYQLGNCLYS